MAGLHMRPPFAAEHHAHGGSTYSVVGCQMVHGHTAHRIASTDRCNARLCQFREAVAGAPCDAVGTSLRAMACTARVSPLPQHIRVVVNNCPCEKVRRPHTPDASSIAVVQNPRFFGWEIAVGEDVRHDVSASGPAIHLDVTVAIGCAEPCPDPTCPKMGTVRGHRSVFVYSRPEALANRSHTAAVVACSRTAASGSQRGGSIKALTALRAGKMYGHPGHLRVSRPGLVAQRRGIRVSQFYQIGGR